MPLIAAEVIAPRCLSWKSSPARRLRDNRAQGRRSPGVPGGGGNPGRLRHACRARRLRAGNCPSRPRTRRL